MKKQVLRLYLEGSGFRSIGRLPRVSNVSVLNRIRKYGKEAGTLHLESIGTERADLVQIAYAQSVTDFLAPAVYTDRMVLHEGKPQYLVIPVRIHRTHSSPVYSDAYPD
ncbi:hypothetical protein Barb6XT_00050 [Bacteroidales bacterium Barb6XT]|nr:hypothetical protein Barb6XT_00050 [Bacteroidales bacterium Barb6XT]